MGRLAGREGVKKEREWGGWLLSGSCGTVVSAFH